ncbi:MAG TPA: NAD-dependent epimerase [Alphaproteobacteria bacterium]|nr:NAD-dependent epimerase [Alphaproteobacteria bacterium]HOO50936.1 NAD-dependent epimerase [Alphaproteobacteria bacterium]
MSKNTILVTGTGGFVGFHMAQRLAAEFPDTRIVGLDNMNAYYDPALKDGRVALLGKLPNFHFYKMDLADRAGIEKLFAEEQPEYVIHLAAQAGVRYSIENPHAYIDSNIIGFLNILEGCRHHPVKHLLYASSSSVYGANTKVPFSTDDRVDNPVSLYAATKKSNELMAHTYSHLYGIPATGLRFFTVYGPWGRPDMAYFKFTQAIYAGKAIDVYNHGDMKRDFTYIDDIVEGIVRLMPKAPAPATGAKHAVFNIGNNQPEDLMEMISILEEEIGIRAERNLLPMQPGDVYATFADVDDLTALTGFKPSTSLREGIKRFIQWYKEYYKL